MNQRFIKLKIGDKVLSVSKWIEEYLQNSDFYWLNDCEVENVSIEIIDDLLYFNAGKIFFGEWKYGIFKNGDFLSGVWNAGIALGGNIKCDIINGVFIHTNEKYVKGSKIV